MGGTESYTLHATPHVHSVEFSFLLLPAGEWYKNNLLIRVKLINRFTNLSINQVNKSIKKESILMNA